MTTIDEIIDRLRAGGPTALDAADRELLIGCPLALFPIVAAHDCLRDSGVAPVLLEVLTRRFYRIRELEDVRPFGGPADPDGALIHAAYRRSDRTVHVLAGCVGEQGVAEALARVERAAAQIDAGDTVVVDLYLTVADVAEAEPDGRAAELESALVALALPPSIRRVTMAVCARTAPTATNLTFRRTTGAERPYWMPADAGQEFTEDRKFRGLHPMVARRLQMWRLSEFEIVRLPADGDVHLFDCVARTNDADRRLVAVAEVRDLTPVRDEDGRLVTLPEVEHVLVSCISALRSAMAAQPSKHRTGWNRVMLYVWPIVDLPPEDVQVVARRLAPLTEGIGIEQIVVSTRFANPAGEPSEIVLRLSNEPGRGLTIRFTDPPTAPMQPLDDYSRKLVQTRRRGLVYPYELAPELAGRGGSFVEYDLVERDGADVLEPVERPPGQNRAGIVVGLVSTPTSRYPEGITRVALLGDPTRAMGAITEDECRRILAAIDLAESLQVPIEWFALSAGAKIAMDSGSENLDWVARVLRRLVEHTQRGGEVNVVVAGINVGAQPYWNAEATMLMHTRGILVMTPDSAMVLTGKQAIDYSGGVSAEDNLGIGGYARIMGPNGEAQYWAPNLSAACGVLQRHYDLTYSAPGERWPRRATTADPADRDVRDLPHVVDGSDFATVGDIFSPTANPDRKKPFDIRTVMRAVADRDHEALERWPQMADAEIAVVHDVRLGGLAVTLIGIESRPLPRPGLTPADGPGQWSAGTLFPLSSKKVARAINASSGSRPVVILANLSGFDGSPESLRRLQLEYGAEIGRAIVNFDGPIVLCVVSRYHGGAFVVFSATLNDHMEVLAVEGSFASVIGGAPAAAVVFTSEVDARTRADERVRALEAPIVGNPDAEVRRRAELADVRHTVRTEKLGEVAAEFDAVHSVDRAKAVGSVHRIVPAEHLRAELIAAVERGMARLDSGS